MFIFTLYLWSAHELRIPTFCQLSSLNISCRSWISPLTVELKAKLQQIPHRCVDMCTYRTNKIALIYLHVRVFIIDWNVMGILFSLHFFFSLRSVENLPVSWMTVNTCLSYQSCFSYLKKALIFQLTASGSTLNLSKSSITNKTNQSKQIYQKLHSSQFPHLSQTFSVSCWLSGDLVYAVWLQLFCTPGISGLICQVHAQAFLYQLYQ